MKRDPSPPVLVPVQQASLELPTIESPGIQFRDMASHFRALRYVQGWRARRKPNKTRCLQAPPRVVKLHIEC